VLSRRLPPARARVIVTDAGGVGGIAADAAPTWLECRPSDGLVARVRERCQQRRQ
jgi:hypothetical protein